MMLLTSCDAQTLWRCAAVIVSAIVVACVDTAPPPTKALESNCEIECSEYQRCAQDHGICVATQSSCLNSAGCQLSGQCHVVEGACAPLADEDCVPTKGCRTDGMCRVSAGACIAAPASCQASLRCAWSGICKFEGHRCHATSDIGWGCAPLSAGCLEFGDCSTAADGGCVPGSDADCKAAAVCTRFGRCHLIGDDCAAATDEDCLCSTECRRAGRCSALGGECIAASAKRCKYSWLCKVYGLCRLVDHVCQT